MSRLWIFAWLLLASCGYSTHLTPPDGYRSLGVEIFSNDSLEPDLERGLHAAMTRTLAGRVDADLVRPSDASAVIRGRLLEYRRRGGIRNSNNQWLESAVTLRAEAELVDERGEPLSRVAVRTEVGFTFGVEGGEAGATARAIDNLAERIVLDLLVKASRR